MDEDNTGNERIQLSLSERINEDILNIPQGSFAVVCIPMEVTERSPPQTRYIQDRSEALRYAQERAEAAATYYMEEGVIKAPHFSFRRNGVYDDSRTNIRLYIGTPKFVTKQDYETKIQGSIIIF